MKRNKNQLVNQKRNCDIERLVHMNFFKKLIEKENVNKRDN